MDTWDSVHVGDVVLGYDGARYGVLSIWHHDPRGPVVTLINGGVTVGPAQPPPGTPITVIERADLSAEARAFQALDDAGFGPVLIGEMYLP